MMMTGTSALRYAYQNQRYGSTLSSMSPSSDDKSSVGLEKADDAYMQELYQPRVQSQQQILEARLPPQLTSP